MTILRKIQQLGGANLLEKALLVLVGSFSVFTVFFVAINGYITDSEYWAITLSQKFGHPGENVSLYYKSIFYGLLKLVYFLPLDNWTHIVTSRSEFAFVALAILALFWLLQRRLFGSRLAFLMSAILAASYVFLTHLPRVRSDYLSTLFYLLFCFSITGYFKEKSKRGLYFSWLFLLMSFLSTPKAFFLVVAGAIGFILCEPSIKFRKLLTNLGAIFLVVFGTFKISSFIFSDSPIIESFRTAIVYAFDSAVDSFANYNLASDFQHVVRFFKNNIFQSVLIFFSFFEIIRFFVTKQSDQLQKFFSIQFIVIILFAAFYNQKYSFFLASLAPVLLIYPGFYLAKTKIVAKQSVCAGVLVGLLINQYFIFQKNYLYIRNAEQKEMIQYLEEAYNRTHLKIYDVIGLLPRNNYYFAFLNESDEANIFSFEKIIKDPPDLIVNVAKLQLSTQIYEYMIRNYRDVGYGLNQRVYRWWDFGESCVVSKQQLDLMLQFKLEPSQKIEILTEPIWPIISEVKDASDVLAEGKLKLCEKKTEALSLSLIEYKFGKNASALFNFDPFN